jgi:hypothetical protein
MANSPVDRLIENMQARRGLIPGPNTQTVRRVQEIHSVTKSDYVAGQSLTVNVQPAPVGIITRFIIEASAIVSNSGGADVQTRVQNGPYALFSDVSYTDTSNMKRISCPSWYLHHLATMRRRGPFNAAYTTDSTIFGNNYNVSLSPASVNSTNAATNMRVFFEVPLAYGPDDLRGAVNGNYINATQQLNLTINPNFFVTSTDAVNIAEAGYQSNGATLGDLTSVTIKVYQEYIDQFAGLPLPMIDLSTQYLLQTSGGYTPVANTDLVVPYANFRSYLSTIVRYNNNGTFNAGTDLNYLAIRAANATDLVRYGPYYSAHETRNLIGDDTLPGYYAISHRNKPLFTNQYGNISLVVQANAVGGANSNMVFGYEQLALMTAVAGSAQNMSGT